MPLCSSTPLSAPHCSHCSHLTSPPVTAARLPRFSNPVTGHRGLSRRNTDAYSSCAPSRLLPSLSYYSSRDHVTTTRPTAPSARPRRPYRCQPEHASNPSSPKPQARAFARPRHHALAAQRAAHRHEQWQDLRPQQPLRVRTALPPAQCFFHADHWPRGRRIR